MRRPGEVSNKHWPSPFRSPLEAAKRGNITRSREEGPRKTQKERDTRRDGKRRRHDREENETEKMGKGGDRTTRQRQSGWWVRVVDEAAQVGLGGWKGDKQPVYYQGSIEKHLGTNRTPPPDTPNHSTPVSRAHSVQTPGGAGIGMVGGAWSWRRVMVGALRWSTPDPPLHDALDAVS